MAFENAPTQTDIFKGLILITPNPPFQVPLTMWDFGVDENIYY